MDRVIRDKANRAGNSSIVGPQDQDDSNPYAELEKYFSDGLVSKKQCPEPIPWWGVSHLSVPSKYRS
jgi:hypothetical protein